MSRTVRILAGVLALATMTTPSGAAECSPLHVWSFYEPGLYIAAERIGCSAGVITEDFTGVDPGVSTAYVLPAADGVQIEYSMADGPETLQATVDGLGHDGTTVELVLDTGRAIYLSEALPISGSGDLTVTVHLPGGATRSVTYQAL